VLVLRSTGGSWLVSPQTKVQLDRAWRDPRARAAERRAGLSYLLYDLDESSPISRPDRCSPGPGLQFLGAGGKAESIAFVEHAAYTDTQLLAT
jgi:hypothetical protein